MKKFTLIQESLQLGTVTTSKYGDKSINTLNSHIKKYIESEYKPFGYSYLGGNKDIDINGFILNTEYIDKMVNNYTVFKAIIRINKIYSEDDFYNYMISNLYDIYNINGKYFKTTTLPILINSTRMGNIGEKNSLDFFKKELLKRNINIEIIKPTMEEDSSGIDGKFNWNNKEITIQVKPYDSAKVGTSSRKVKVHSQGSLSLNTDYLIVYKGNSFIIVKGKDVTIEGNYFTFQEEKIVARQ